MQHHQFLVAEAVHGVLKCLPYPSLRVNQKSSCDYLRKNSKILGDRIYPLMFVKPLTPAVSRRSQDDEDAHDVVKSLLRAIL
jgi:hypothetical protein